MFQRVAAKTETGKTERFERIVLPHLEAAFNLARWLTRNSQDAEDVVQEACLRAFTSLDGYHGGASRAWVLAIVRNASYDWLSKHRKHEQTLPLNEEAVHVYTDEANPEILLLRGVDRQRLHEAVEGLPVEFREIIVLREMEEMSYSEIARIAQIPAGTVMSRLARARKRLRECLANHRNEEA